MNRRIGLSSSYALSKKSQGKFVSFNINKKPEYTLNLNIFVIYFELKNKSEWIKYFAFTFCKSKPHIMEYFTKR